jgi:hypothetical protein
MNVKEWKSTATYQYVEVYDFSQLSPSYRLTGGYIHKGVPLEVYNGKSQDIPRELECRAIKETYIEMEEDGSREVTIVTIE